MKPWPLYDVLTEKYEWEPEVAKVNFFSSDHLDKSLVSIFPQEFADFLIPMLAFDPADRATAEQCLKHPFLQLD